MRAIIIIFIIQAACIKITVSQPAIEKQLLDMEMEIYTTADKKVQNYLLEKKFALYISQNKFTTDAFKQGRRVDYRLLSEPQIQKRHLWNTALLAQMLNEHNISRHYYNLYQDMYPDTCTESLLLKFFIHNTYDTIIMNEAIIQLIEKDPRFEALKCYKNVLDFEPNSNLFYVVSSAIIPGSGNLMIGNFSRGLSSLALNSATVLGVRYLILSNMYVNALFWGTGFGLKFYAGNIRLTEVAHQEKSLKKHARLARNCENSFNDVLKDYQLEFK
jgi:hypothetical protein